MKTMLKKLQKRNNKKGFTLVEIIVVLVIMAILAAIAVPAVMGYIQDAKDSQYLAEARSVFLVCQTEYAEAKATNSAATTVDKDKVNARLAKDSDNTAQLTVAPTSMEDLKNVTFTMTSGGVAKVVTIEAGKMTLANAS